MHTRSSSIRSYIYLLVRPLSGFLDPAPRFDDPLRIRPLFFLRRGTGEGGAARRDVPTCRRADVPARPSHSHRPRPGPVHIHKHISRPPWRPRMAEDTDSKRIVSVSLYRPNLAASSSAASSSEAPRKKARYQLRPYHVLFLLAYLCQGWQVLSSIGEP